MGFSPIPIARGCAAFALIALVPSVAGCGPNEDRARPTSAVATTMQAADLTRQVGGERVAVDRILSPSSDPHAYEPRPSDARAVADADVVVRSGGEIDGWLDGLLAGAGTRAPVVTLLDAARRRRESDEVDPHWWQDPRNGVRVVRAIRDALVRVDPAGRKGYEIRGARAIARLERLDRSIATCVGRLRGGERKLVTSHDAFGYYADRYGLRVIGALIPSRSTQAQPSAGETDRLVRQLERERVKAIFPESALNPKLERAVAGEAGTLVGSSLWSDTLGKPGSDGATYSEALASNTEKIVAGLSGGRLRCRPRA